MSKKKSNIKEKIRYEQDKAKKIEDQIIKIGGHFNVQLVRLDVNLKVIKNILFKEKKITEEEFDLEYFKKLQVILNNILKQVKEMKKKQLRIIVPTAKVPKNLRKIEA